MRLWLSAWLLLLLPGALALGALGQETEALRTYASPPFGWSVQFPADWTVNDNDLAAVVLTAPPPEQGLVTISVYELGSEPLCTDLDAMADFLLDCRRQIYAARGLSYRVTGMKTLVLGDWTSAVLATEEIGGPGGGKTEVLIAVKDEKIFTVVAETYATEWPKLSARFDGIVRSFKISTAD